MSLGVVSVVLMGPQRLSDFLSGSDLTLSSTPPSPVAEAKPLLLALLPSPEPR